MYRKNTQALLYLWLYACLFILHSVYWISHRPHTDQILLKLPAPPLKSSRPVLDCLSIILIGENLVPKSSVQDEEGSAREGAPWPSRTARGRRSHDVTFASKSRGSCPCQRREALHRRRQRTAANIDGPAPSSPPPSDAIVHASPHTPSPPAAAPSRLVVVPVSYWWWVLATNCSLENWWLKGIYVLCSYTGVC